MTAEVRRYGTRALLVEPAQQSLVLPLAEQARRLPGVVEVVPAARTVLVRFEDQDAAGSAGRELAAFDGLPGDGLPGDGLPGDGAGSSPERAEAVLDVVYEGPDLAAVAAELGVSTAEVTRLHSSAQYVVAFCGFAPGFAYLTGLPDQLRLPRLAEPRANVPAGSVAIADEFTGVYPRRTPGGWRLLGRTDAVLWDVQRDPPALLTPGTPVRFRPT